MSSVVDMRTRDKIWILLFAVTLSLGALIVMLWDADTVLQFRRLLSRNPMALLSDGILDHLNSAKLWYGGTALVALIMFVLLLKTVRGGEIQAFKERLVATEVAKAELETLLQDTVWKEKHALQAKEAALKDLQAGMNTLLVVERQLAENEKLLRSRDSELKALRARLDSLATRPVEPAAARMQQQVELGDELRKKTELLRETDAALKELEKQLTGKVQGLEAQLTVKDKLLNERARELEAVKGQLAEKTASTNHAENSLAAELRKEQQALQAKDSAMKAIEKNLTAKLHALEIELKEKQELLGNRSTEADAFKSEVARLTAQLADLTSVRERSENSLQQELRTQTAELQSRDAAFKELEREWAGKTHALENQLVEKQEILFNQSVELQTLRSEAATIAEQQTDMALAQQRAENALQRELDQQTHLTQEKDAALKDQREQFSTAVRVLEGQLAEKETLLREHDAELEALRFKVNTLAAAGSEKTQAESVLQQELRKQTEALQAKDAAVKHLEELLSQQARALQGQLANNERLLKDRDAELETLRSKVNALTETISISERTESLLLKDLRKEQRALRAKDTAMKELEQNSTAKLRALEIETNEKQELLRNRNAEVEAFKSEVTALKGRLAEVASAVRRTENAQQQELKDKTEAIESKDAAIKQLQETLSARVNILTNQLKEKDALLKERDGERDALSAQLAQTGSTKREIEDLLRKELGQATEVLEAKGSSIRELEKSFTTTIDALEKQVSERDTLLQSRYGEIDELRSEVAVLRAQLIKPDSVMERAESLLFDELSKENRSNVDELEESLTMAQALEIVLREKEDLLKTRDAKIERLEADLQEKRKELAKHDISAWQAIERRELWKHRLAKLGITLKDRE